MTTKPGQPCPKCGHPMPPRIRRCYRCTPAKPRGPITNQPRDASGRLRAVPVPANFKAEIPVRTPPPDPAIETQSNYARLAEAERRRTVTERHSQMHRTR